MYVLKKNKPFANNKHHFEWKATKYLLNPLNCCMFTLSCCPSLHKVGVIVGLTWQCFIQATKIFHPQKLIWVSRDFLYALNNFFVQKIFYFLKTT